MSPVDPLRSTYRYEIAEAVWDEGRTQATYGTVFENERFLFRTWPIDATTHVFEADPCSCGCEGCGLLDGHAHRSGPYVVWTWWCRREARSETTAWDPLLFGAAAYSAALGGDAHALPVLDGCHASLLVVEPHTEPATPLWWEGDATDDLPEAEAFLASVRAVISDPERLAGAELVALRSGWKIVDSCSEDLVDVAVIDDALAVRLGPLRQWAVMLRVPSLRAGLLLDDVAQ